jgi:electron transfer flavoprotein-quinone oxidoreductase
MYEKLPAILCDFGRQYFGIRNEPTRHAREMLLASVKKHASIWELAKLGYRASRSL